MFEKLWSGITGVVLYCLEVILAISMAVKRPRIVTSKAVIL